MDLIHLAQQAVTATSTPELNALMNVVQLAVLVAILRWVRGDSQSTPRVKVERRPFWRRRP